ncbi:MAG: GMC family oxidoreductase [Actinomycetales bacterium]|nr:GMC family oxidoreductase [Actinomycetales bacterium]
MASYDFDVAIIGSGFGGSVAALRLTEKGYRVGVLEAGQRFTETNYPKTSWDLRRFLWAPKLGMKGLQRIHLLRDVVVLAGAGVGGGSLVYANTLYVPGASFFNDPQWRGIADWATELAPYYDQASRMLGVVDNPTMTPSDVIMKEVADEMGVGHTFRMTPVGVYFGAGPGVKEADPFFGGVGPERTGCIQCGECMTGCRHNAKNTLPKNYLGLAEAAGAVVHPLTTVTAILPRKAGGYAIITQPTGLLRRKPRVFTAEQVVMAAGTYNTQRLLHRMKDKGQLPNLSATLGRLSRTNSESILGAVSHTAKADYTQGVAITSSWFPDEHTHVEPVRYGRGSNSMGLLQSVLTVPRSGVPRWRTWLGELVKQPRTTVSLLNVRRWSERAVISLVMQPVDNSLTLVGARGLLGRWKLTTRQDASTPAPTYLPVAQDVVQRVARRIGGVAGASVFENFDAALTAHFVGGCVIGADSNSGVIDAYHRAFGHEGLHVVDGSAITANLGVNPSLTITAQAERAMAMWPNKGEADPRPALGSAYQAVTPVAPRKPVVPVDAPAALRLPLIARSQSR